MYNKVDFFTKISRKAINRGIKQYIKEQNSFNLIKEIFKIIKIEIKSRNDLINLSLNHKYLRSEEFKHKIVLLIPNLKEKI